MTPILIIAGVIAALILFRWARTLLIFGIAGVLLWSLAGCEAQRLIFPTPTQQRDESTRLQNQLDTNLKRMAAAEDERIRQAALIASMRSPAEKQRDAEQNAANMAREAEIEECIDRLPPSFRARQRYSGQMYELCASHFTGPFWAFDLSPH